MTYLSYEDFISQVQNRADLARDATLSAVDAVLNTLADRISGGEAQDLAAELPPELGPRLRKEPGAPGDAFSVEEFYERVASRSGLEAERGEEITAAVFSVLEESLSRDEVSDMKAELPEDLKQLLRAPQR